jgi:hypothetical protein
VPLILPFMAQGSSNTQIPLSLLGLYSPSLWTEDLYIESPPFLVENSSGRIHIIPVDSSSEEVLDNVSKSLGLVKRRQGQLRYLVNRTDSTRALRLFDWFIRRSWHDKRFSVLWAIIYIGETKGWSRPKISLESVAELTNCDLKQCSEIMKEILDGVPTQSKILGYTDYDLSKGRSLAYLARLIKELPSWTDELVMKTLCSGTGGSVQDVHEQILSQGLGMEASYKIVERLKRAGYVFPLRHYRVNERGPMREQLSANCRNCFYGYSSEDKCLMGTLRQMEELLSRYYGRRLSKEERQSLYASIKLIPFGSRVSRKVLESLGLIHQVETITNERAVLNLLTKIEEGYQMDFPIKKSSTTRPEDVWV